MEKLSLTTQRVAKLICCMVLGMTLSSCQDDTALVRENNLVDEFNATEPRALAWTTVFTDEFDGGNVNTGKWRIHNNRVDNNSSRCTYMLSAVAIDNLDGKSCMRITATKTGADSYQSGFIETLQTFKPLRNEEYRFTASIKLIAQDASNNFKGFAQTYGAWPAFWTVQGDAWPTKGEIDIVEAYSKGEGNPTDMKSNLFYGTTAGVNLLNNQLERAMPAYTEGWHTFDMRWKNQNGNVTVTIRLDGAITANYTNANMSALKLENFGPHVMVLNLNIGDNWGIFDNSRISLFARTRMYVDFARVSKRSL